MRDERQRHSVVHITGGSGVGATTLGGALAAVLACVHLDTDNFYWLPTDPPYRDKRQAAQRIALLEAAVAAAGDTGCVLSGSLDGWGDPLIRHFRLVVFLRAPTDVRLARLRARETLRYREAIAPGGPRHDESEAFIAWASGYESGIQPSRSLRRHEAWLADLPCPVLRLDATSPVAMLVEAVHGQLGATGARGEGDGAGPTRST